MKVSSKSGHGRHAHNYLIFLAVLMSSNDPLCNRRSNLIPDWVLGVVTSRDEELILDINEMLTVMDDLYVCICNRVLII